MTGVTIAPTTAASPVESGSAGLAQSRASASTAATTKSGLNYPNPSLRLDSQLGLVVIEFFSSSGSVSRTIPSSQQLAAYQQWNETGSGSNPLTGAPGTAAAAPALRQAAPQPAPSATTIAASTAGTAGPAGAGLGGAALPVTVAADAATINVDTGSAAFVPVGGPSAAATGLTPAAVSAPAPAPTPAPAPAPAPLPTAPAAGTTGLTATH